MICCSFAPWCPACKSVKPTWESFATQWSEDLDISVATVNIKENPGKPFDILDIFQLCHQLYLFTNKFCETFNNFASHVYCCISVRLIILHQNKVSVLFFRAEWTVSCISAANHLSVSDYNKYCVNRHPPTYYIFTYEINTWLCSVVLWSVSKAWTVFVGSCVLGMSVCSIFFIILVILQQLLC